MKTRNKPYKILFLCSGNSARSIMGEYLIRRIGSGRFDSYSAGTEPTGRVNPYAIRVLQDFYHIDASEAYSKGCDAVNDIGFDFVITVCDRAREVCPVWPGQPIIAHWGSTDPALATGTDEEKLREFKRVAMELQRRIELLCALPIEKLDRLKLEKLTRSIGNPAEGAHN